MKSKLFKEVAKQSLENAEQWIRDAELLVENASYGHSYSLLVFADEEIAKAYVCWLVSEDMIPLDSKMAKDVFSKHRTKHETLIGLHIGAEIKEELSKGKIKIEQILEESSTFTREDLEIFLDWMDKILDFTERMRQKGIYVDFDEREDKIVTPESISKEETEELFQGIEYRFEYVKELIREITESQKSILRQFFKNLPKETWKTSEITYKE